MKWKLFANFAEVAGMREIEIEMGDEIKIGDALSNLFEEIPELRSSVIDEKGEVHGHIQILHNGEEIEAENFSLMLVRDTDELAIIPPMSGG